MTILRAVIVGWMSLAVAAGCSRGEIEGTYKVELEVAGVARPLDGILMFSTWPLDVPSPSDRDSTFDPSWLGIDTRSANSCFILSSPDPSAQEPGIVRVFEARLDPGGVATPIEIVHLGNQRIEIVRLQLFQGALGGEVDVHVSGNVRHGRIHGARVGPASPEDCLEALDEFRSMLREETAAVSRGSERGSEPQSEPQSEPEQE